MCPQLICITDFGRLKARHEIKDESMDLKKMAYFAIHTLTTFLRGSIEPLGGGLNPPPLKHRDSLNNIARQNRIKRKENLGSIACAEGQWFVLHRNRAAF